MHKKFLTHALAIIYLIGISIIAQGQSNTIAVTEKIGAKFTEGLVYSRTTFPGHPLNDSLKKLDYESGDFLEQFNVIQALKKHQKSIKAENEQGIKDVFFVSAIMILPAYSKMYFTPQKALIRTDALGYHQESFINITEKWGKISLADREKKNQGTVRFQSTNQADIWQKYTIDAAQYTVQKTNETAVIAGIPCKKIIYTFTGTSRSQQVGYLVLNMLPQKVTAWYSEDLHPSINLIHPLYFELQKAILKFEVEYDKNKKNKMLVEITKMESAKFTEENFETHDIVPVVDFDKKKEMEAGMIVMQVMMNAIALLTK